MMVIPEDPGKNDIKNAAADCRNPNPKHQSHTHTKRYDARGIAAAAAAGETQQRSTTLMSQRSAQCLPCKKQEHESCVSHDGVRVSPTHNKHSAQVRRWEKQAIIVEYTADIRTALPSSYRKTVLWRWYIGNLSPPCFSKPEGWMVY